MSIRVQCSDSLGPTDGHLSAHIYVFGLNVVLNLCFILYNYLHVCRKYI